jgi:hypothetical protein
MIVLDNWFRGAPSALTDVAVHEVPSQSLA